MSDHSREVQQGERFRFGANWTRFLSVLNDERLEEAKSSLRRMLHIESLAGLRVRSEIDRGRYPGGVTVTDAQLARVRLERHRFHGDWNYTIHPVMAST